MSKQDEPRDVQLVCGCCGLRSAVDPVTAREWPEHCGQRMDRHEDATTLRPVKLKAKKLTSLVKVTEAQQIDSVSWGAIERELREAMGDALMRDVEQRLAESYRSAPIGILRSDPRAYVYQRFGLHLSEEEARDVYEVCCEKGGSQHDQTMKALHG